MLKEVMVGGSYTNKKTGNRYFVLSLGKHTETQEDVVIYVRGDIKADQTIWVRPLELFKEKFEI